MSPIDEIRSGFEKKLDQSIEQHQRQLEDDLRRMRQRALQDSQMRARDSAAPQLARLPKPGAYLRELAPSQPARLTVGGAELFHKIQDFFDRAFHLVSFSSLHIAEQVVFCFTLEQYLDAYLKDYDVSEVERNQIRDAMLQSRKIDSLGVFLPNQGCFINGWAFEQYQYRMPAAEIYRELWQYPEVIKTILHEWLGHGFLASHSRLGQVEGRLGRSKLQFARDFHLRSSQNPAVNLQYELSDTLLRYSLITEEGWSTWIANLLAALLFESKLAETFEPEDLLNVIQDLPFVLEFGESASNLLIDALTILFDGQAHAKTDIQQAMLILQSPHSYLSSLDPVRLDAYIRNKCGLPLRYVVGNCLLNQAEQNLGPVCAPYAALIALNIDLIPGQVGLADLNYLIQKDPALNPDTRLAILSKFPLGAERNNPRALAQRAEQELSLIAPSELKPA